MTLLASVPANTNPKKNVCVCVHVSVCVCLCVCVFVCACFKHTQACPTCALVIVLGRMPMLCNMLMKDGKEMWLLIIMLSPTAVPCE
jgi:hypothetical protein